MSNSHNMTRFFRCQFKYCSKTTITGKKSHCSIVNKILLRLLFILNKIKKRLLFDCFKVIFFYLYKIYKFYFIGVIFELLLFKLDFFFILLVLLVYEIKNKCSKPRNRKYQFFKNWNKKKEDEKKLSATVDRFWQLEELKNKQRIWVE